MDCKATNSKGEPCGAHAVKDDQDGKLNTDFCIGHQDKDAQRSIGFGGPQEGSGRKRRPSEIEMYEKVWRENVADIEAALERGIKATRHVVVGNGPTAHVEEVPDIPTQLKAVEIFTDRIVGKPRQAVEITGEDGGPVEFTGLVDSPDWHQGVARVLAETGAHGADPDQDQ